MKERKIVQVGGLPAPQTLWPDPTPEMLESPIFEAIWQCVKTWDVNVRDVYRGYCGASGNHVRAILDAVAPFVSPPRPWLRAEEVREPGYYWCHDDIYRVFLEGDDFVVQGLGDGEEYRMDDFTGLWQRIPEPELPKEEKA